MIKGILLGTLIVIIALSFGYYDLAETESCVIGRINE